MRILVFLTLLPVFSYAQIGRLLKDKASSIGLQKGTELMSDHLKKTRQKFDTTSFNYSVSFSDQSAQFEDKEKLDDVTNLASIYLDKNEPQTPLDEAREQVDMGEMYYATNAYSLAETSFFVALGILEYQQENTNLLYPRVLADIGMLYSGMGRYNLAMEFTTRALELRKELRGEQSVDYAASLNNLAVLNKNMGNFNEAEELFTQTLALNEQTSGKNSMPYAITLNNRGVLYQNLGRYSEAEQDLKQCLQIAAKELNTKSGKYARFQTNLGLLYQQQQKYDEAEAIFQQAIIAMSRNPLKSKKSNPDYAHLLEMKASLYIERGNYSKAEPLLTEAIAIYERKFGADFSGYGLARAHLGALYRMQGNFSKAKTNLTEGLGVLGNTYGQNHPYYVETQTELALLYWQQNDVNQADSYFQASINQSLKFVGEYFAPMSDVEKALYWKTLSPRFEKYFAFAASVGEENPQVVETALNYRLITKAMLLSSTTKVKRAIMTSGDTELINMYNNWIDSKRQLAVYYAMSKEDLQAQQVNTDSIKQVANNLEKKLSQKSGLFNDAYGSTNPTYLDVQQKLLPGEAAIELVRIGYHPEQPATRYMALIVQPATLSMVVLHNGDELETKYFKYYRNTIKLKRNDSYSYQQFWGPIAEKLSGISKIYLSSDGVYNQLNVNSLKSPQGVFVVDAYTVSQISSLRMLVENPGKASAAKSVVLVGNPAYGSDNIDPLPGTGVEISKVASLLKSVGYRSTVFSGAQATEQKLKAVESPKVLHIATHGFFIADVHPNNNRVFSVPLNNINENVLLRSGLLLANAGKQTNPGAENGILTAYEAMNLTLDNTDLVVLSACETGLGDILAGEGVYGLQRAFEVAGAKTVIMSLWRVNDAATQLLMTTFYKNWVSSKDKLKAFRKAQETLKTKYPEPYYWGAFVLQGK